MLNSCAFILPPGHCHFSKPSIPTIKLTSQSSRTETGQLRFGEMELLLSLPTSVYSISRVVFLVLFECRVVILPRSWEKRARSPANFMEIYISWWIDTMFVVHTGVLDTHASRIHDHVRHPHARAPNTYDKRACRTALNHHKSSLKPRLKRRQAETSTRRQKKNQKIKYKRLKSTIYRLQRRENWLLTGNESALP